MTGAIYRPETPDSGVFLIPVWGQDTILTYPEFEASDALNDKALGTVTQALLLYYFLTADGTSDSGQWISFSDLPDGRFYNQAFQGYTGAEIVKHFKSDREAFERAAQKLAGFHTPIGDAAYTFKLFPHFPMVTVFWQGDEDFPSTLQILFAASAHHYLPTDACAIAGSILTRRLLTASS
jgi:hypothetical protein